jgi:predicted  nucleic acid-binding Zn-ribbon protein
MHEEVIAHMRGRIQRMRKVISLAHDPRMIEMLEQMIEEAEGDIRRLEMDEDPA